MIVIDASVAAKWCLPEKDSEAALSVLESPELLVAPSIIRLEVLSAITRRLRTAEATPKETSSRCEKWLHYLEQRAIALVAFEEVLENAVRISIKLKHPLADCIYIALAEQYDATMITSDRGLHKRASGAHNVKLLKI